MTSPFPLSFDGRGRTTTPPYEEYVRGLIEQVLFVSPGERVNRDLGAGLLQLVFAPNSDELSATTQMLVQGALQHWLGEIINLQEVDVRNEDATLHITVRYVIRRTQARQVATFVSSAPATGV
ncbi:MAG TPA: GPW/gp25 family protein [Gemmatimonadaceae bacterium]|nr:GPW/gp25 family protein [Gemmatimonadaceae bacterium]